MANTRTITFLGLLAQGTAVVISILLAFAIQAWWDDRQEREEERQILEVLATDLRKGIEVIEFGLEYHTAKQDSALHLIEASEGLTQADPAQIESWLCDLNWDWGSKFESPAFETLLGGGLSQVQDPRLRFQIARLEESRRYTTATAENDRQTKRERLFPYFQRMGYVNHGCARPGGGSVGEVLTPLPVRIARDHTALLNDPEFVSLATFTYWDQWDGLNFLPVARQTMQEVLEAVEAELEGISR